MALTHYIAVIDTSTPAATPIATPILTQISLGDVVINSIELRIPLGHNGYTGLQVRLADSVLIPWGQSGGWVTGNDEHITVEVDEEITVGLVIATYNLGAFTHAHLLRIDYTPISLVNVAPPKITVVSI